MRTPLILLLAVLALAWQPNTSACLNDFIVAGQEDALKAAYNASEPEVTGASPLRQVGLAIQGLLLAVGFALVFRWSVRRAGGKAWVIALSGIAALALYIPLEWLVHRVERATQGGSRRDSFAGLILLPHMVPFEKGAPILRWRVLHSTLYGFTPNEEETKYSLGEPPDLAIWRGAFSKYLAQAATSPEILTTWDLVGDRYDGTISDGAMSITQAQSPGNSVWWLRYSWDRYRDGDGYGPGGSRRLITLVGAEEGWPALGIPPAEPVAYDLPLLALLHEWRSPEGGPDGLRAITMGGILERVGQPHLAWEAYAKALDLRDTLPGDASTAVFLVDHVEARQAAIEHRVGDSHATLMARHQEELAAAATGAPSLWIHYAPGGGKADELAGGDRIIVPGYWVDDRIHVWLLDLSRVVLLGALLGALVPGLWMMGVTDASKNAAS